MIQKLKNGIYAASATFLALPAMVRAQVVTNDYGLPSVEYGPSGAETLPEAIASVLTIILGVLGAICVLLVVIAGIMYMTSGGDEARVEKAKNYLIYAIVGLIVAVLGYVIVNTVMSVLG